MENSKKRGPRILAVVIVFLIILFFAIEFYMRESQEFSPTSLTNLLLWSLQIIVLILFLILFFVLGRNLTKLYLERKRKVVGSHFKTKLVLFFIALSFIPTLLLFFFASDLISRNIEQWFRTPLDKILEDTKSVADGVTRTGEEATLHFAQQLAKTIKKDSLLSPENRLALKGFIRDKLAEYQLDEIGIYLEDEELFSYLNPNLPLHDYRELKSNIVKRAQLGEVFRSIEPMGNGLMIRRGVALSFADVGNVLVTAGKFFPQNYAQRMNSISSFVLKYQQLKIQKNPVKTFYFLTLIFITLLIVFAASWIGFHLAKSITVPIEKLAQATRDVSKGDLDVRVEDPASDELGILIESFNQMIFDLKDGHQKIAQKTTELESRKQYIETILNNITTGVMTVNAQGTITTINPSAREMLGLTEQSLVDRDYKEILSQPRYAEILKQVELGMKNRYRLSEKELQITSNGQTTTVALALSPLRQPGGEFSGMIIVLDNLTQLIKAQKIATWKEVAQRVAHEIKNPLTPIQLSAERIIKTLRKGDRAGGEVIEEGAKTIIQETRTIKSLVDEFSNFARMPKVELKSCDLRQIIEQTVTPFRGIFTEIEFEVEFSPDIPSPLQLDPEQMKRALINIIDNAIDAMNKKGRIRIVASFDGERQRVNLEITDSGPGISVEDKLNIFLPHFSTKKKGTGLGLAIVNQIIREHNGNIVVENNRPHGARFIIQLPS